MYNFGELYDHIVVDSSQLYKSFDDRDTGSG